MVDYYRQCIQAVSWPVRQEVPCLHQAEQSFTKVEKGEMAFFMFSGGLSEIKEHVILIRQLGPMWKSILRLLPKNLILGSGGLKRVEKGQCSGKIWLEGA